MAEPVGQLMIELGMNVARLRSDVGEAKRVLDAGVAGMQRTLFDLKTAFAGAIGVGTLAAAARAVGHAVMEEERALAMLTATLRATGHAAGFTRAQLVEMAERMQRTSIFDDEDVMRAQATLLKFGNIYSEVFERALRTTADLAAFMGTGMQEAAQMLGKTLQSPTEGLMMMERNFGKLTDAEEAHIRALVEAGRSTEAQMAVLDLWQQKIGGASDLLNSGLTREVRALKNAWDDFLQALQETGIVGAMTRTLRGLADIVRDLHGELRGARTHLRGFLTEAAGEWLMDLPGPARLVGAALVARAARMRAEVEEAQKQPGPPTPLAEWMEPGPAAQVVLGGKDLAKEAAERAAKAQAEKEAAERAAKAQAALAAQLRQQVEIEAIRAQDLTRQQEILLLLETERYRGLAPAKKAEIAMLAAKIDLLKAEQQYAKELAEDQKRVEETVQRIQEEERERLKALAERSGIEYMIAQHEALVERDDIERAQRLRERAELIKAEEEETRRLTDAAREIGLTFSSAFEDAIVSGKRLSEVLRGLAQDVARIFVRRTVTEPLAADITDWIKGFRLFGRAPAASAAEPTFASVASTMLLGGFQHGGEFTVRGAGGTDSTLVAFRATPGERVTVAPPGSGGGNVTVNVVNQVPAAQARVAERRGASGERIVDVLIEHVTGAIGRNLARGEGLAPLLERRYGLSPSAGALR